MTTLHTDARGITLAVPGTHDHQRRGIQSAVESVQDVLDAWPDALDRPDVYDALYLARAALNEARDRLAVTDTAQIREGQRASWAQGRRHSP